MLGIPLLSAYIQRVVKAQSVADSVDWLNYYCTSLLLAFFALAISAKQYFGSPIQCWVPNEFKGSWERYAEDYCFVANSYFVPFEEEVPRELVARRDQISYYRWIPVALAVQALLFWLPNWLWSMLHKQTAINPRAVLAEASKGQSLHGTERDKEIEALATFVGDTLAIFSEDRPRRPSGLNATLLYLGLKLFYVLNCFGQLIVLNRFLGGQYHSWAWESLVALLRGEEWRESAVFPRVIMCDFTIRRLANPQRHSVQCVIMLNLINEKLYFFLHFWFLFVGLVTLINFFFYLFVLMVPALRIKFVKMNMNKGQQKLRGFGNRELNLFVQGRLRPDGILLFHFLRQHIGGRVTYDLLNEMLRQHWLTQTAGNGSSGDYAVQSSQFASKMSNASSSPSSEKAMLLLRRRGSGEEEGVEPHGLNSYSRQNTYKPTAYGPRALVYPGVGQVPPSTPVQTAFSPASLLRAISGTASPTLPNGNHYSMAPTLDFIDGANMPNGSPKHAKPLAQVQSSMNTTPLAQSRRAKSPLVTGLGSIGKRLAGNVQPNQDDAVEDDLLKSTVEESKSPTSSSNGKICIGTTVLDC